MFFSTDLLARRDSGYGLLWLAATLGSKSKKLGRREVVSADIARLCNLVSQPPEPLALRLSSNLMIGVVRVYKIKYEIFESDVSNCVVSLRKNLNELRSMNKGGIDMIPVAQRPDTLNLQIDPAMYLAIELDGIIDDWDVICRNIDEDEKLPDHPSFLSSLNPNISANASASLNPYDKKKLHKLDESFEHLFSSSFLKSLGGENLDEPSTSPAANINDVLFNLDFDEPIGLGEEMEKDLEEAWNLPLRQETTRSKSISKPRQSSVPGIVDPFEPYDDGQAYTVPMTEPMDIMLPHEDPFGISPARTILAHQMEQMHVGVANPVQTTEKIVPEKVTKPKVKEHTIILDPTTELSDEQMKANRQNYFEEMKRQKLDMDKKRYEKERKRKFEEALWNPPSYFYAPELVSLWNERVINPVKQQEALWKESLEDNGRPKKRRQACDKRDEIVKSRENSVFNGDGRGDIMDLDGFNEMQMDVDPILPPEFPLSSGSRRSSQDLGQPRHASNPPLSHSSILEHVVDYESQGLLSNNIFPWDNALNTSSTGAILTGFANRSDAQISIEGSVVRLRKGSGSIGSSPTVVFNDLPLPDLNSDSGVVLRDNDEQLIGEDSDHIVTLERNSFNFLGYAKMHATTVPGELFFSDIVPLESSSARVAAEGFYHCLALATKKLINLNQTEPYGLIKIRIL